MKPFLKVVLSLSLIIFTIFALGCGSPSGDGTSQITIRISTDSAGAAKAVSVDQLRHVIVFSGPTGTQTHSINGAGSVKATVVAGLWTITATAYYGEEIYATGAETTEVKAGQNTSVTIRMNVVWTDNAGVPPVVTSLPPITIDKEIDTWEDLSDYIATLQTWEYTTIQINKNLIVGENSINDITIPLDITVTLATPLNTEIMITRENIGYYTEEMFNVEGTLNLGDGNYPGNSKLTLDGTTSANARAALIKINGGTLNMHSGVTLEKNENITSGGNGGAVWMNGGAFYMKGGTIKENKAENGGAVYAEGTGPIIKMGGDSLIEGNTATGEHTYGIPAKGGGLCIAATDPTLEMEGNAAIRGNHITEGTSGNAFGGGVYFEDPASPPTGTFKMSGNSKITGNKVEGDGSTFASHAYGGGVYFFGAKMEMYNSAEISHNELMGDAVLHGGGARIEGDLVMDLDASSVGISYNIADGSSMGQTMGGGIFFLNGNFTLTGYSKINRNTATNSASSSPSVYGGGVFLASGGNLTMSGNSEIKGNKARGPSSRGGGVYFELQTLGSFTKSGGTIDGYAGALPPNPDKNHVIDPMGALDLGHALYVYDAAYFYIPYGLNRTVGPGPEDSFKIDTTVTPPTSGAPPGWDF